LLISVLNPSTAYEECRTNERTNEDVDYSHSHIAIAISPKVKRFYVPQYFQPKMKLLEAILKREGVTLSAWIRRQTEEYVRLHEPGNPQQRIDTIMKLGKAYRAVPLCSCGRKGSRRVVTTRNATVYCCSLHMPHDVLRWKEVKK